MSIQTLPDPVHWSEGMLLSPQHLQQNDIAWQAHLNHRLACVVPHARGIGKLALDRESLGKGIVRVTALECLLDDGHAVIYPGNYRDLKLECEVGELCRKTGRPVRVWLALPRRGIDGAGFSTADRRYDVLPGELTGDENLDNGYQVSVERMQARIRLLAGTTVPPQYAACPLLEVALDAQGRFRLTPYHPPMLHAGASGFQDQPTQRCSLQSKLEELTARLWGKLRELGAGRRDDAPQAASEPDSEDARQLATAHRLAACLPPLEIAVASRRAHPEDLYRALAQVVGQVASIGADPIPLKMEPYAHDDCMPLFERAIAYIDGKLALVNTLWEHLDFARFGEGGFARRLPAGIGSEVLIELKYRAGQNPDEVKEWLRRACIASSEVMPEVRRRRLLNPPVRELSPQEIVQRKLRPQSIVFAIRSETIDIEGKGRVPLFAAEQSLLIQGAPGERMPAAIVLALPKAAPHAMPPVPAPAHDSRETDTADA